MMTFTNPPAPAIASGGGGGNRGGKGGGGVTTGVGKIHPTIKTNNRIQTAKTTTVKKATTLIRLTPRTKKEDFTTRTRGIWTSDRFRRLAPRTCNSSWIKRGRRRRGIRIKGEGRKEGRKTKRRRRRFYPSTI